MKTTLQTVSPQKASKWLKEANTTNRVIRIAHVNRIKTAILSGKWIVTHQGIAFADDGSLIDGQHRLMAIEAAGRPVEIMVTTGVPKFHNGDVNLHTMDVIDCGKPRTTADQLHLLHGIHNSVLTTAAARMISVICCKGAKIARSIDVSQALAILEIYGSDIELLVGMAADSKICRHASIIASIAFSAQVARDHSLQFMQDLKSGSGIKEGDPVYAIREMLIRKRSEGTLHSSLDDKVTSFQRITMAIYNTIQGTPIRLAKASQIGLDYFMAKQPGNVTKVKSLFLL